MERSDVVASGRVDASRVDAGIVAAQLEVVPARA